MSFIDEKTNISYTKEQLAKLFVEYTEFMTRMGDVIHNDCQSKVNPFLEKNDFVGAKKMLNDYMKPFNDSDGECTVVEKTFISIEISKAKHVYEKSN